jgi:general L-amino acid transport system permease protein
MTDTYKPIASRPSPVRTTGVIPWMRANLFGDWKSIVGTVIVIGLAVRYLPEALNWTLFQAVFRPDADACQAARGTGACWGVIAEKYRIIIFGRYPYADQWRPLVATLLLVALLVFSCISAFWKSWLAIVWIAVVPAFFVLMGGGWFGLSVVPTDLWGGLPLTIMLATFGIVLAFPLAVVVALGRRSNLPAIRTLCIIYVELVRGVPLISVLFMASFLFPLFMPIGKSPDVLLRVLVGIILFGAAYLAETVRGGLQAIPKGQVEAAQTIGLLADAKEDRPAAGADHGGAGHHEQLHRHLQGHVARDHREPLRADRRDVACAQFGRRMAALQDRGLPVHHADLLCLLLLHVALQPVGREAAECEQNTLGLKNERTHHHLRQGQQVVRERLPRAA